MVYNCSVPHCRGNRAGGPKVGTFGFPKDPELRKKWVKAIQRKNFVPTKHSRVCELHFLLDDVERETSCYDEKTGRTVTAKLDYPRLKKGVVPSVFSAQVHTFKDSACQTKNENDNAKCELAENSLLRPGPVVIKALKRPEDKHFATYADMVSCMKEYSRHIPKVWLVWQQSNHVLFAVVKLESGPQITLSVVINSDLELSAYYRSIPLKEAGGDSLPLVVNNIHKVLDILEELATLVSA